MRPLDEVMAEKTDSVAWRVIRKRGDDVWVEYTPKNSFFLVKAVTRFTVHQPEPAQLHVISEDVTTYFCELYLGKEKKVVLRFSARSVPELLEKVANFIRHIDSVSEIEVVS